MLGLPCCAGFSLVSASRGCSPVGVLGLRPVMTSLVEHGLYGTWASVVAVRGLSSRGSGALERRLSSRGSRALERRFSSCGSRALERRLGCRGSRALERRLSSRGSRALERRFSSRGSRALEHRLSFGSPALECQLSRCGSRTQSTGSVVVVHGLSCSSACGILPDHGSNPVSWLGR